MLERDLLPTLLATLLIAPLMAWLVGRRVAAHLRAIPGQARRWMPTLPELPAEDRTPAARFDRAIRRAERLAFPLLRTRVVDGMVRGIHAEALAAEIAVPVPVARALLDDWRRHLPCRLRVTRGGLLLHDFPARALNGAARGAWHALPQRLALMAAAVLANLGALWWVVIGVLVGLASLRGVLAAWDQGEAAMVFAALGGVGAVAAVFALSQAGAWLVRMVTWRSRPTMAAPEDRVPGPLATALQRRASTRPRGGKSRRGAARAEQAGPKATRSSSSSASWWDGLSELSWFDGEGFLFIVGAVAVAALVAAVLGGLAVVCIWLRGLWLAVRRLGEPVRDLGPAAWLRQAQSTPQWERWVPTNDLAIRLVRALARTLQLRPADAQIANRVLGRAKAQGGRVAALDIALDNALDLGEAMSVATRLVARLDGDIEVSEAGDLDFSLPADALRANLALPDAPELEYLRAIAMEEAHRAWTGGTSGSRGAEDNKPRALPVNLPGLTRDHVLGATRLAGGPLATVAMMAVTIAGDHGDLPIRGLDLSLGALFCVLAPGTLMLAAATRQAVAESARHGLLRDVRRLALSEVRRGLDAGQASVNGDAIAASIWPQIDAAQVGWTAQDVGREVDAALADIGLEPEYVGRSGRAAWPLSQLRQRLESLAALRAGAVPSAVGSVGDHVVFDSGELG